MAKINAVVTNPAKKKKPKRRRKMSALQLKYFGKKRGVKKNKAVKRRTKIKIIEVKAMAKRRRKRTKSYKPVRRRIQHNPVMKRRRVKRNPSMSFSGILDILLNGAIGGAGALTLLFISDIVAEKFLNAPAATVDAGAKAKRNIATLIIALLGGWASMKFIKGKKGEALAVGMVSGAVLRLGVNMFGLKVGLGESTNVDSVLNNLLSGETLLGADETLLGMDDSLFGEDDTLLGEIDDSEYDY